MWEALCVLHVTCTWLHPGLLSIRVGDGSRRSEKIVKIGPFNAIIIITIIIIIIITFIICYQDSAAISGGEDGDGGLSPRRDPSHPASHAAHPVSARNNAPTAASPVDMGGASGAGATQREFLRSLVADAMEEVRDDLHHDIQGLHVSMLRQFHNFEVRSKAV